MALAIRPACRIFPIALDNVFQFLLPAPVDQTAHRSLSGIPVHAHVQRAVGMEAESALGGVDLQGRHSDINQCAVDLIPSETVQSFGKAAVTSMKEMDMAPKWSQSGPCQLKGLRVSVQPAQQPFSIGPFEQGMRMPPHAHGAVKITTARLRTQCIDRLVQQDGDMDRFRGIREGCWFHGPVVLNVAVRASIRNRSETKRQKEKSIPLSASSSATSSKFCVSRALNLA